MLDAARITALLQPFLGDTSLPAELVEQLQTYLELLLRWNARTNLTAVRDPEQIVTRHFGESLFAARLLRDAGAFAQTVGAQLMLADIGSGAGFPGLPVKMLVPDIRVTVIESHHKKATFLREVVRALNIRDADVFCGRAETWRHRADVVTLRAVERFNSVLPVAANLVKSQGILCLLTGAGQIPSLSRVLASGWDLGTSAPIPQSREQFVVMGKRSSKSER